MTVLSAQTIRRLGLVEPLVERQQHPESGCSFGLSSCGYDIRLDQDITIHPGSFVLASSMEKFHMHHDVVGVVHDKSTWIRRGLMVHNTVLEPGWTGFLTLELAYHLHMGTTLRLAKGTPIAQVLFHRLDQPTDQTYKGKYQNQERGPQEARSGVGHE